MKRQIIDYVGIFIGCLMVSVAFVVFINPYKIVPGGVFGTSIVLHSLNPHIQVGTYGYMIAIPLLILSYFFLGKSLGVKTLFASLITPLMMNILSTIAYPDADALQTLDPALLFGGKYDLSDNLILCCIFGPMLMAAGEALIMRCHATSGGSDIVAMLIHKYTRVRFSYALLGVDATVIILGLVVNGITLTGYSLICAFVAAKTIAILVSGTKNSKLIFIITSHGQEEMREFILHNLDRTATVIQSEGLYSQENRQLLMMAVRFREVNKVTSTIREIDPNAFVIVTDAYDTLGVRWNKFPKKGELELG